MLSSFPQLVIITLVVLLTACGRGSATNPATAPTPPPIAVSPAVKQLVATFDDEVHDLPGGQIMWTTYWKLCWEAYPKALAYELEPATGEGTRRHLTRQTETCFRIEIAKGQNAKAQGMFNRELMLASLAGQMTYRVRAVLGEGRVSQWSESAIVGQR